MRGGADDGHDVVSRGLHPGAPEPGPHDHAGADVDRRVRRLHPPVPHQDFARIRWANSAIQLFSFADYQANFGGFFSSPWQPDYVGQAVYQFFLNGGPTCYVVGLPAQEYLSSGEPIPRAKARGRSWRRASTSRRRRQHHLPALQPVGIPAVAATLITAAGIPMQVAFSNVKNSTADAPSPTPSDPGDMADIVITYGTTVETYRKVQIANLVTALQNSSLVTVTLLTPPPTYREGARTRSLMRRRRPRTGRSSIKPTSGRFSRKTPPSTRRPSSTCSRHPGSPTTPSPQKPSRTASASGPSTSWTPRRHRC